MREQIVDFIRERGGGVSFAEFKYRFGDAFEGDVAMCLPENENVILWTGMSEEFYEALTSLLSDERVQMTPTSFLVYLADGVMPRMPLVRGRYQYKTPHWLPVSFSLVEERAS
jgi:hypothetical protein